jgi:hypothetical protein
LAPAFAADCSSGRPNRPRPGYQRTRLSSARDRGEAGDHKEVLTGVGLAGERPDTRRRRKLGRPALVSMGGGVPALFRRRKAEEGVQLGIAVLVSWWRWFTPTALPCAESRRGPMASSALRLGGAARLHSAEARHGWRRKKQGARAGLGLGFKGRGLAWRGSQRRRRRPCCEGHDLCGRSGSAGPRWASAGLLAGPARVAGRAFGLGSAR